MSTLMVNVCVGDLQNPKSAADHLAAQGVRAIEAAPPERFLELSPHEVDGVVGPLRERGISIRSVHAPFGKEHNLSSPDSEVRRRAVETHIRVVRQTARAGASVLVIHPGTDEAPNLVPQMREWIVESLAVLARAAEDAGVRLGLENMLPRHPGTHGEELLAMLDAVGSPALGICFDTGHAHCNGDMAGIFRAVKDRIVTFHVHDNDGKRDLHLQPPYGTIFWDEFVRVFRTMAWDDYVTVEAEPWARGNWRRLIDGVTLLLSHFEHRIAEQERRDAQKKPA
jgi:sugar phosphate isomerase/epimerase